MKSDPEQQQWQQTDIPLQLVKVVSGVAYLKKKVPTESTQAFKFQV